MPDREQMRHVAVGEAQVGDRIAEAIYNENGRVLLPVGARLSEAVLSRLNGWGVDRVAVQREEDPADEGTNSLLDALEHRFAGHEEDPLMMRIKGAARRHLSRHC